MMSALFTFSFTVVIIILKFFNWGIVSSQVAVTKNARSSARGCLSQFKRENQSSTYLKGLQILYIIILNH
jgi:hypothetical protein